MPECSCSLGEATVVANAHSNLSTGSGSFQADLIVDFLGQPAPGGNCNIVNEHDVFTLGNGTILIHIHSNHEDCATHGLRIDTTFEVTGGTGDFAGATGGGREFSAMSASPVSPIITTGRSPSSCRSVRQSLVAYVVGALDVGPQIPVPIAWYSFPAKSSSITVPLMKATQGADRTRQRPARSAPIRSGSLPRFQDATQ